MRDALSRPNFLAIAHLLGTRVFDEAQPVGGGSISDAFRLRTQHGFVFAKVGKLDADSAFRAEAAALLELESARAVCVPKVLVAGAFDDCAYLCLEWLELGTQTASAEAQLGEQLAELHRHLAPAHGWDRDNFIGSTPQHNSNNDDWVAFFRTQRLQLQLSLARDNRADPNTVDRGERLCESLGAFFTDYRPAPSLLHGDLWSGNWGSLRDGQPVIFDPATYYGDRETDLAMTRLFGGFGAGFYAAYELAWPLDVGATPRITLYNLYHVLNHFNLFGGAYLSQARSMIDRLLAEVGKH